MFDDLKETLRRAWPALAMAIAAIAFAVSAEVRAATQPLVEPALPITFGAALALSLRFGRTRVAWSLFVFGAAWLALPISAPVAIVAATAAPLAIAGLLVAAPASPATSRGLVRAGVLGGLAWGVARGADRVPIEVLDRLAAPTGFATLDSALALPTGPAVAGALALAVAAITIVRRRAPLDATVTVALAVALAGLSSHVTPSGRATLALLVVAGLLIATIESSYDLAFRDRLTGLLGRRALDEALAQQGRRYTVAMVDVDHFKKFNDRYGHDAGDRVLRAVARRLDRVTGGGRAYRYGGEEFTVLFPRRSADDTREHLETLRKAIRETRVTLPRRAGAKPTKTERRVSVTVSIGAAERTDDRATPEAVVKDADRALYKAKNAGRNRVELA